MSEDFTHRFLRGSGDVKFTLLLLHGTGGNENDLIPLGNTLAPGAPLLSPRGKTLENGMPRWFRRFADGVFDTQDLVARSRELAQFVGEAAKRYGFDAQCIVPVGYSNGANIAAAMMLLGLLKPPAAVLFRAMVPLVPEAPPQLSDTRIFIGAGSNDPLVSPAETAKLVALFEAAGANVQTHFTENGHHIDSEEVETAAGWIQQIFKQ